VYGIRFTNEQLNLIQEINLLLGLSDDDGEEYWLGNEDEELEESRHEDIEADDLLAEKLFLFRVKVLTQRFQQDEGARSPLLHFSAVLGIDVKNGRFQEPGNYTPMLAGLIWVGRLLLLEYALPKREYKSLNWPSREVYNDYGLRLEHVRQGHLIEGCYSPTSDIISLMAYGKYVAKQQGKTGLITWDSDSRALQFKGIRITMMSFKEFIYDIIKSAEELMCDTLMS
jgi:hypothetical protein